VLFQGQKVLTTMSICLVYSKRAAVANGQLHELETSRIR